MGYKQTGKYCPYCQKDTLAVGTRPNHILHLILTILTGGCWALVWIFLWVFSGRYRCQVCGRKV